MDTPRGGGRSDRRNVIDDVLRRLRRHGVDDERLLAELQAHLEDAVAEHGVEEALRRFGSPRAVARSVRRRTWPAWLAAVAAGSAIAWVDSRPGWDATGITVGTILLVSASLAWWRPRHAWRWGLVVGGGVPLAEAVPAHNAASTAALGFGLAGSLAGWALRRATREPPEAA